MMILSLPDLSMTMRVPHEYRFIDKVDRKSSGADSKAGECALQSVPARKRSRGSPCLSDLTDAY